MIVKIQNRRGQYVDFDPSKLLPGEFAIVQTGDPNTTDGKSIYICVTAGNVKQIATLDELQSEIETVLNEALPQAVEEATEEATAEADRAEAAATQLASTVTQVATNTADIAQLNNALDVTEVIDTTLSSSDLENGAVNPNGMNTNSLNYRVRTTGYIELPENDDVYVNVVSDENVYFTAWYYTVNDFATSKIGMEDWRKSGKLNVISNAKYVRFIFSINKSTNPISPSDIDSVTISHIESALDDAVKVTPQTLTDEQKAQARANIGAISDEEGLLANFTINNGYICQVGGA